MASWCACALREGASSCPVVAGRGASASLPEGSPTDQRFPRSSRLTARRQFLLVYQEGARVPSRSFVIFGMPSPHPTTRLGLTVTRKVGSAVVRNRAKRRMRDLFRRNRHRLTPAIDLVINIQASSLDRPLPELEQELFAAFDRLARRLAR